MLIAPTEPLELRILGTTSSRPETYGSDFLLPSKHGLIGVQRKEFPSDFLASLSDGRMARFLAMMSPLPLKFLVIEGRPVWTIEGALVNGDGWGQTLSQAGLEAMLLSVEVQFGVRVVWTDSIEGTAKWLMTLDGWVHKGEHLSLIRRPGPPKDSWGKVTNRAWALHLMQGFPGMGPILAGRIVDHFGEIPLRFSVTQDQLEGVPGVGKGKASRWFGMLESIVEKEKE